MTKLYQYKLLQFLLIIFFFYFLGNSVTASIRPPITETQDTVYIRLSQVYFKSINGKAQTYLPQILNVFTCEDVKIRDVYKEWAAIPARSTINLHGNRDYYAQRGDPMVDAIGTKREHLGTSLEDIEYLGGKNSNGIYRFYGYWWGVDTKPTCDDKSVITPIYGDISGDVDGTLGSGGYDMNIRGTGIYSGSIIKLLHLNTLDKDQSWRPIAQGTKVSTITDHMHVTYMFGIDGGKIDIPFQYLISPETNITKYKLAFYTDGSSPKNEDIMKYVDLGTINESLPNNGFDTLYLEQTYKYLKTKTTKNVILDIGVNTPTYVEFDSEGKFVKTSSSIPSPIETPVNNDEKDPKPTVCKYDGNVMSIGQEVSISCKKCTCGKDGIVRCTDLACDPIYKYKMLGYVTMYSAIKTDYNTYEKGGKNGKYCMLGNIYNGKRIDAGLLVYGKDMVTIEGICTWYDRYMIKQ